jgi:uncharacterized protein (TIGR02996 family)
VDPEERSFITEIQTHPYDDAPRLVYADWLEERGDPRGEYLRLECELVGLAAGDALFDELRPRFAKLRAGLDRNWLAEIGRTRVAYCFRFRFRCPQRWQQLTPLKEPGTRFCGSCKKTVYYCPDHASAYEHARQGHCVALDATVSKSAVRLPPQLPARNEEEDEEEGGLLLGDLGIV